MLSWKFTRCTQMFSFLQSHDWCNWYKSNAILLNSVVCKSLCTVTRSGKRRRSRIWQIQWSRWDEMRWYDIALVGRQLTEQSGEKERGRSSIYPQYLFFTISFIQSSIYNAYLFFCIKAFDFSNCCLPWTDRRQLFLPELKQLTSELTFNFQYDIRWGGTKNKIIRQQFIHILDIVQCARNYFIGSRAYILVQTGSPCHCIITSQPPYKQRV